jgi:hypothetical protein
MFNSSVPIQYTPPSTFVATGPFKIVGNLSTIEPNDDSDEKYYVSSVPPLYSNISVFR